MTSGIIRVLEEHRILQLSFVTSYNKNILHQDILAEEAIFDTYCSFIYVQKTYVATSVFYDACYP